MSKATGIQALGTLILASLLLLGKIQAQPTAPAAPESDVLMGQYLIFQMPQAGLVDGFRVYWGPVGDPEAALTEGPIDMSQTLVLRSDNPAVYEWNMLQPQRDQNGNPIAGTTAFAEGTEYCFEVTAVKTVTTSTNSEGRIYESPRSNRICARVTPKPQPPTDLRVDD